jgi:hypothetical protein
MRTTHRRVWIVFFAISAGYAAAGCTPAAVTETSDPSAAGVSGFLGEDGDVQTTLNTRWDGRLQLWSSGVATPQFGQSSSGTLKANLPDSGVDIGAKLYAYDTADNQAAYKDLGMPEGSTSEVAVYHLLRPAGQVGKLVVDYDPKQVQVRITAEWTAKQFLGVDGTFPQVITQWSELSVNGGDPQYYTFDSSPMQNTMDVEYYVLVVPGGVVSGQVSRDFDVTFRLEGPNQ